LLPQTCCGVFRNKRYGACFINGVIRHRA
jgi:hypothetical protein